MNDTPRMSNKSKPNSNNRGNSFPAHANTARGRRRADRIRVTSRSTGNDLRIIESTETMENSPPEMTIQGLVATLLNGDAGYGASSLDEDDQGNGTTTFDDDSSESMASDSYSSGSCTDYSFESAHSSSFDDSQEGSSALSTNVSHYETNPSAFSQTTEGSATSSADVLAPSSSDSVVQQNSSLTSFSNDESTQAPPRLRLSLQSWQEQENEDETEEDATTRDKSQNEIKGRLGKKIDISALARTTPPTSQSSGPGVGRRGERGRTSVDSESSNGQESISQFHSVSANTLPPDTSPASSDTTQPTSPSRAVRPMETEVRMDSTGLFAGGYSKPLQRDFSPVDSDSNESAENNSSTLPPGKTDFFGATAAFTALPRTRSNSRSSDNSGSTNGTALQHMQQLPIALSSSTRTAAGSNSIATADAHIGTTMSSASTKDEGAEADDELTLDDMVSDEGKGSGSEYEAPDTLEDDDEDEDGDDDDDDDDDQYDMTVVESNSAAVDNDDAIVDSANLALSPPSLSMSGQFSGSSTRLRVPGGAAAKLMLLGPKTTDDEVTNTSQSDAKSVHSNDSEAGDSLREIEFTMNKARQEFEKGTEGNRRYQPISYDEVNLDGEISFASSFGGANAPSFLNRNEIFYETAAAAIYALLTPRERATGLGAASFQNLATGASGELTTAYSGQLSTTTSFPPQQPSQHQHKHMSSAFTTPDGAATIRPSDSYHSYGRQDVSENLITPATEKKLEAIKNRMHDPNKTLADLLLAIATPEDKEEMDLGFMVRRKNACGALKVLTNDVKKRVRICWTVGVLPALTSVLADIGEDGLVLTFPDKRIRAEYEAARDRAIIALLNLVIPKENRIPIFHTPNLIWAVLKVIHEDKGAARKGCTAILAYLAKSLENRLLLAQVPGFYDALISVLRPMPARLEPIPKPKDSGKKKSYPWEADASDSEESSSVRIKSVASDLAIDSDSEKTPKIVASKSPIELSGYDETADDSLRASRQNIFALLGHLVKEKDNTYHFGRYSGLLNTFIDISKYQESPSHTLSIKLLASLTRHRMNSKVMVFQERRVVPALVHGANSESNESRLYACFALQNLAQEKSCRQELAMADDLVPTLCNRGRFSTVEEERLAAISALKNLCDEPANLIPLTNTPECISTLMHLAHGKEEGVTETMQYRACDALATLSHWLRKIATSGKNLDDLNHGRLPDKKLFVPSLKVITWNQWQ